MLAERGYGPLITIVAEHLPGDTAVTYTSPWYVLRRSSEHFLTCSRAGCNFSAISGSDPKALRWDRLGYAHLSKTASQRPGESYVQRTPSTEFWDEDVPHDKIQAMSEYLEDVRRDHRVTSSKVLINLVPRLTIK